MENNDLTDSDDGEMDTSTNSSSSLGAVAKKVTAATTAAAPMRRQQQQPQPQLQQLQQQQHRTSRPDPDMAFEDLSSSCPTSSECSPMQKPRQNRNSGASSNRNSGVFTVGPMAAAATAGSSPSPAGTKLNSKRNSLDGKTVQGLAQDLAAECAKAYALMENSLSKLTADFGGPFGMSGKVRITMST